METFTVVRLPVSSPAGSTRGLAVKRELPSTVRISRVPLDPDMPRFSTRTSTVVGSPRFTSPTDLTATRLTSCRTSVYGAIFGSPTTTPIQPV